MAGKKKQEGREYGKWGGYHPKTGKNERARRKKALIPETEIIKGEELLLIRRIGQGDFDEGLKSVLKDWRHF